MSHVRSPATPVTWTIRFAAAGPTRVAILSHADDGSDGGQASGAATAALDPASLLERREQLCAEGLDLSLGGGALHLDAATMRDILTALDRCADEIRPRPHPRLLASARRRCGTFHQPRTACA